jgi:hypothetical protein
MGLSKHIPQKSVNKRRIREEPPGVSPNKGSPDTVPVMGAIRPQLPQHKAAHNQPENCYIVTIPPISKKNVTFAINRHGGSGG